MPTHSIEPPRPPAPVAPRPARAKAPKTSATPKSKDDLNGRILDAFLLNALSQSRAAYVESPLPDVLELHEQSQAKSGVVLTAPCLDYESTPVKDRRVPVRDHEDVAARREGEEDGIVTIAHVVGGDAPRVVTCTGFAIGRTELGMGATIATCAHTLQSTALAVGKQTKRPLSSSFALTSRGYCFPVLSVVSSLPSSDVILLQLAPEPMRDPLWGLKNAGSGGKKLVMRGIEGVPRLKSLPVSPYPAVVGTPVASVSYRAPFVNRETQRETLWDFGKVVEYKDSIGRVALTGTYDELNEISFTHIPSPGSSGGPIIELATGAVVGMIKGYSHKHGDPASRGIGTPAEKIFHLFQLPGFVPKSVRMQQESEKVKMSEKKGTEEDEQ